MIDAISPTTMSSMPEMSGATAAAEPGFGQELETALQRVDKLALQGDEALVQLARGGEVDLHGAMIALQEADIAVRAMVTVRDKLVSAYDQLMNLAI
jgi:flagellar hook-basal body complex protein FliE